MSTVVLLFGTSLPITAELCAIFPEPRAPVAPSCVAKIGYEETVRKVYETVQVKGKTSAVVERLLCS